MKYQEFEKQNNKILVDIFSVNEKIIKSPLGQYYCPVILDVLKNRLHTYINFDIFREIEMFFKKRKTEKMRIIDIGCGLGDKAIFLKKLFKNSQIFGVETTQNDDPVHVQYPPYKFFKNFYYNFNAKYKLNLSLYDGLNLKFDNNYFDIIVLYAVIEHISPQKRKIFLEKIVKKLKKGGYIIITRCPRSWALTEFILRQLKMSAHYWRLAKKEFLELLPSKIYKIELLKNKNNIPFNPSWITNRLTVPLIVIDKLLSFLRWPLATNYFLIVRKK